MIHQEEKNQSIELQRHLLGSINLNDIENKEMGEVERKNYCAIIFTVFPTLEKDIKQFLYEQLMFSSNQADTWEKVIFGRGTFNGMDILLKHWQGAANEHIENLKLKEENKENFIDEI